MACWWPTKAGASCASTRPLNGCWAGAASKLESKTVEDLIPARFRAGHARLRARYSALPRNRRMGGPADLTALQQDGSETPVDIMLSYARLPTGNQVMAIIRDMTEIRQTQESPDRE